MSLRFSIDTYRWICGSPKASHYGTINAHLRVKQNLGEYDKCESDFMKNGYNTGKTLPLESPAFICFAQCVCFDFKSNTRSWRDNQLVCDTSHTCFGLRNRNNQDMKPRLSELKFRRFGNAALSSPASSPNQRPSVAAYCSTDVVGIKRPRVSV